MGDKKEGKEDAYELLSRNVGDAHYRIFKLKDYFNDLNSIVHYYINKFGPYLPEQSRSNLAILALEADKIAVDLSRTIYDVRILRAKAQAHIDRDRAKEFSVPEEVAERLSESIKEMEERVALFAGHLDAFIRQIIDVAHRDGIA